MHVAAALQRLRVDPDVEHHVADTHQVHGAHLTGAAWGPVSTGLPLDRHGEEGWRCRRRDLRPAGDPRQFLGEPWLQRGAPFLAIALRRNFFQSLDFVLTPMSVAICSRPMRQHGRRPPGRTRGRPDRERGERGESGDRVRRMHPGSGVRSARRYEP